MCGLGLCVVREASGSVLVDRIDLYLVLIAMLFGGMFIGACLMALVRR